MGGAGGHKVPVVFSYETVKASKYYNQTWYVH